MRRPMRRGEKGRRGKRVASVVRQIVSETLVGNLNDPRLAFVTVTGVEVSADLRFADVRVSVLGDEKAQEECLRAIGHSRGHIQQRVADALDMKYCPFLRFHRDDSVKRSVSISAVIAKARAEDEAAREDRIRRGIEDPEAAPEPAEESPPVPLPEEPPPRYGRRGGGPVALDEEGFADDDTPGPDAT